MLFFSWRIPIAVFLASKYINISVFGSAWDPGVIGMGSLALPYTAVLKEKWISLYMGVGIGSIISVCSCAQLIPSTHQASLTHSTYQPSVWSCFLNKHHNILSQVYFTPYLACSDHSFSRWIMWECVIDTVQFIISDPAIIYFYIFKFITTLFQIYHPSCYEDYQNVSGSFVFLKYFAFSLFAWSLDFAGSRCIHNVLPISLA